MAKRILLFLSLVVVLDLGIGGILGRLYRRTYTGERGGLTNYALTKNADILVLGSSRAQYHVMPSVLSQTLCPRIDQEGVKEVIKGSKIELVDVRADDIDQTRAKRNVEDTITARPEINCMVGFYSYNTPRIYEALKEAGKIGKVTIIGFDEDPITLGGVKEGTIVGTVVQQPYEWGYQGMKMMAKYLEGDKSFIPANKLIIIPTKIIDKSNVDAFWAELKQRQGKK